MSKTMPDYVQIRLYIGDKYLEIRLPTSVEKPIIRGELIDPPHKNPVEGHGLMGRYDFDVVWVEGEPEPKVTIRQAGKA